jgi:5-amino-6-(5-phosphoribosylamino)uracil reductase
VSRVFVFSNLATSLDGKIATASREYFPLGTEIDRRQMQVLRKRADALLMGASTLRTFRRACGIAGSSRKLLNIVVSRELEGVSPDWPFFKSGRIERLLVVTGKVPEARLRRFEKTSAILHIGSAELKAEGGIARAILRRLGAGATRKLLIEGGGGIMWDFARLNLIDEYHVTLTPKIVGGAGAPTLVDGRGFTPDSVLGLKLLRCRRVGDELYLVYGKKGSQRVR